MNSNNITLINDDCLTYMKTLDDNTIDMVCVEPSYGTTKTK